MLRVLARCAEQTDGDAEAAFAAYRAAYTELQPAVPYHLCMARYQLIQEHLPAAEHEIWSIADLPEASRAAPCPSSSSASSASPWSSPAASCRTTRPPTNTPQGS